MEPRKALRILHITDLHLRDAVPGTSEIACRRSRQIGSLLDRLEQELAEIAPDFIAITGDLLHAPYGLYRGVNPFDMAQFSGAVRADYRSLKARFDRWQVPYLVLPGNHDDMALLSEVFVGTREQVINDYRILAFDDMEHGNNVPLRTGDELQRYSQCLSDGDPRPQIHLQHYVAHPVVEHPYPHNFGDRDMLLALLVRSTVRLCLSGHFHPGHKPVTKDGVTHIVGRGFCEAPHPVGVIDIDADGGISYREIEIKADNPPTKAVIIDRSMVLHCGPSPDDQHQTMAPEWMTTLSADTLVVLTSDLDHPELMGLGWAELADWHDALAGELARRGIRIDALYYTTRLSVSDRLTAGIPRIALGVGENIQQKVRADTGVLLVEDLRWHRKLNGMWSPLCDEGA